MIAVIFEVVPAENQQQHYLELAAELKKELEQADGFISIERFQSLTTPEKLLSLSFWRDEIAVEQWRNLAAHRRMQSAGRSGVFAEYRLRVAGVIRDYTLDNRDQAPLDSECFHGCTKPDCTKPDS